MKPLMIATVASMCTATAALIVGLAAAWYWWKASKIEIDPGWNTGMPGDRKPAQPADTEGIGSLSSWTTAIMMAITMSSDLNRKAAILTAISVALAGCSSFTGALAAFL